jgi:cation transport regulator ChaC
MISCRLYSADSRSWQLKRENYERVRVPVWVHIKNTMRADVGAVLCVRTSAYPKYGLNDANTSCKLICCIAQQSRVSDEHNA